MTWMASHHPAPPCSCSYCSTRLAADMLLLSQLNSQTPIFRRGPLNTSLPLRSTCSLQLGSSMMADWGHGRYMAAICGDRIRDRMPRAVRLLPA